MKNIVLFLSILFISFRADAQGNLQLNQVKFLNYQTSGTTDQSYTLNVPSGKTLKIESAGISPSNAQTFTERMFLQINNVIIAGVLVPKTSSDVVTSAYPINFPIWLPAGDYTIKIPQNFNSIPMSAFISAIEFNIVP